MWIKSIFFHDFTEGSFLCGRHCGIVITGKKVVSCFSVLFTSREKRSMTGENFFTIQWKPVGAKFDSSWLKMSRGQFTNVGFLCPIYFLVCIVIPLKFVTKVVNVAVSC